jgi:hypothetical protein
MQPRIPSTLRLLDYEHESHKVATVSLYENRSGCLGTPNPVCPDCESEEVALVVNGRNVCHECGKSCGVTVEQIRELEAAWEAA